MTVTPEFFDRAFGASSTTRLVDEDPDLFAGLGQHDRAEAHARAVAPVLELGRGPWQPAGDHDDGLLGLLVLDGLLVHSVVVAHQRRSEVVGAGDILRPWQEETHFASVPFAADWQVVDRARVAVLDGRFCALAARWPQLLSAVLERAVRRSHRLAVQLAIADLRRVEERLMLFLWHLADRWGRVGPGGVTVPLPITHEVLAQLVCAQRPTVTSALRRLADEGRLARQPDRTWLLLSDPPPVPAGVRRHLGAATG